MTERARHVMVAATAVLLGLVLIMIATSVAAHPEAERYIPIGMSPGISGKYSYQGPIAAVDETIGVLSVGKQENRQTFRITEQTKIWIDRSKSKRSNLIGSQADCRAGRMVEIMYLAGDKQTAKWIKIAE